MKRIVASALILSILSSSAAICYGMGDEIYELDDFSGFVTGDIPEEVLKGEKKYNKAVDEQKRLDEQTKAEKAKLFADRYGKTLHEAEDLDNKELEDFVKNRRDEEDQNRAFSLIKDTFDEAKAEEERLAREKAAEEERQSKEAEEKARQEEEERIAREKAEEEERLKKEEEQRKRQEEEQRKRQDEEAEEQHSRKVKGAIKGVAIGAGVTAAIALVAAAIITPCVIYKDQIKKFFCEDVKNFFTKTLPNAFKAKKSN